MHKVNFSALFQLQIWSFCKKVELPEPFTDCLPRFKCHCLRKCSRGQKLWSTDLAETWHRSWVWYFKSHFGSLLWLLVLELQGGLIFCPLSTKNPAFWKCDKTPLVHCAGKWIWPWTLLYIMELSVQACNFVLKVLDKEEPGALRVWSKLMLKLQSKIAIFQNFTIFTCLLA